MERRSDRFRRWASLSALASAALATSTGSGEATIIFQSAHGVGPGAILPLPNGNIIFLGRFGTPVNSTQTPVVRTYLGRHSRPKTFVRYGFFDVRKSSGAVSLSGVSFRRNKGDIAFAKKGQTFNQVGSAADRALGRVAYARYDLARFGGSGSYVYGPRPHPRRFPRYLSGFPGSNFSRSTARQKAYRGIERPSRSFVVTNQTERFTGYSFVDSGKQYALFRFDVGSQTDYGWLEMQFGNIGDDAPFTRLIGYAYDDTGKPIPAAAVPEPKQLPLALGALALGAIGVREWRKKRNAAP